MVPRIRNEKCSFLVCLFLSCRAAFISSARRHLFPFSLFVLFHEAHTYSHSFILSRRKTRRLAEPPSWKRRTHLISDFCLSPSSRYLQNSTRSFRFASLLFAFCFFFFRFSFFFFLFFLLFYRPVN